MRQPTATIALFLLASFGCSDPGSPLGDAEVELGTGTVSFEPLAEGAELVVVAGPQGGFHFNVHARARGIVPGDASMPNRPDNPTTTFSAYLGGQRVDFELSSYQLGYQDDGDAGVLPSGRLLFLDDQWVGDLYDQQVRIDVSIVDRDGDSASDSRTITALMDDSGP